MDVEKRLLEDADSFTRGAVSLDEEGFVSRTLAALGITRNTASCNSIAPEAGRTQRPAPAGDTGSLVENSNRIN